MHDYSSTQDEILRLCLSVCALPDGLMEVVNTGGPNVRKAKFKISLRAFPKKSLFFPKNVWPVSVQAAANNDECSSSSSSSSMTHQHGCCRMVLKKCRIGCLTRCRVSS